MVEKSVGTVLPAKPCSKKIFDPIRLQLCGFFVLGCQLVNATWSHEFIIHDGSVLKQKGIHGIVKDHSSEEKTRTRARLAVNPGTPQPDARRLREGSKTLQPVVIQ